MSVPVGAECPAGPYMPSGRRSNRCIFACQNEASWICLLLDAASNTAVAWKSGIGIPVVIVQQTVGVRFPIAMIQADHAWRYSDREIGFQCNHAVGSGNRNHVARTNSISRPGVWTIVEPGMETAWDPDPCGENHGKRLGINVVCRGSIGGQRIQPGHVQVGNNSGFQFKFPAWCLETMAAHWCDFDIRYFLRKLWMCLQLVQINGGVSKHVPDAGVCILAK